MADFSNFKYHVNNKLPQTVAESFLDFAEIFYQIFHF